jgi:serine/threonine protein kinase/Tfp pilus assembly protein PilF
MAKLLQSGEYLEKYLVLDRFMGAWGVVYVLKETEYPEEGLPRPQIIIAKTLRPEWAADARRMQQFEQECYTWLSLGSYPHIVRLYTVDRFSDQAYALGEYIPRILLPNTLREWIDYNLTELEIAFRFGIQITRALLYARQNAVEVHQDLKPENIMVTPDGAIKITDWGISRMVRSQTPTLPSVGKIPYAVVTGATTEGTIYGTPGYAAPELYQAGGLPTSVADIYSLGVILVEMITGERPQGDAPLSALEAQLRFVSTPVRKNVMETIQACLSRQPANRPNSLELIENTLCKAFEDLTELPAERRPLKSWDTGADLGQRAYALFMLGRIDEAMKLQARLMEDMKDGPKPAAGLPASPMIMMDYKEHGWRAIIPQEHMAYAKDQLSNSPTSPEALKYAVSTHMLAEEYETVLQLITDWMKHSPATADLLSSAGYAAKQLERWHVALNYYDRSLALNAGETSNWVERAEILQQLGRLPEAIASLKELLKHDPKHVMAHIMLGHYYAGQEQYKDALKEFQEATTLDPKNAVAFYNLGTMRLKLGDQMKAVEDLETCIKLDKNFAQAHNTLASIYFEFAQMLDYASSAGLQLERVPQFLDRALDLLDDAIRIDPKYARPWFNKGQMLEYKGDLDGARQALQQAIQLDPNYVLAINALQKLSSRKA